MILSPSEMQHVHALPCLMLEGRIFLNFLKVIALKVLIFVCINFRAPRKPAYILIPGIEPIKKEIFTDKSHFLSKNKIDIQKTGIHFHALPAFT